MLDTIKNNFYDFWIYPLYILTACIFTAGLNIVHSKYILGIELTAPLFIVPTIAGCIFGYLAARIRLRGYRVSDTGDWQIFAKYILFACLVTSGLNVAHTELVLEERLSAELFVAPLIAGVFFGYLLARIKTLNNRLLKLATTDMLTQLCNRMQFDNYLTQEIEKVKRYGGTFSVIYFDIDNFKQINDQYGHLVGDKVLSSLATHIESIKRKSDIFARYGGDEFIILAPSTNLKSAEQQAKLLKRSIEELQIDQLPKLSCSFGVTEYKDEHHNNNVLINVVDKALYTAKSKGRDTVVAT
ncbi:GGDEF domain-containing protein [Kaarinaea lacus]